MDTESMIDVDMGDSMNDGAMGDSMDDLFGDNAGDLDLGDVTVALPVANLPPPPAALLRRLAEMQASGCCTKLAWSNTGSIARISEDGTTVTFRILERHVKTKTWSLSDESKHSISAPIGCRFVHLAFNLIGQDLALADNLGRLHLHSSSGGNGKMHAAVVDTVPGAEKLSELDAVVGLHWLPQYPYDCRTIYIGPASRSISGWTSQSRPREPNAIKIHHPADNGRALLYVSRSGKLTLLYHQESWKSASTLLQIPTSVDGLLTHADLCEHNGELLLVTSDSSRHLHLYSIDLNWNTTYTAGPNQTQLVKTIAPELRTTALLSIPGPFPHHEGTSKLVQLSLVPPTAEVADQSGSTSTTLLATFVRAGISEHASQESVTMLLMWQIDSEVPSLHTSFRNLKPNMQMTNTTTPKTILRRQPDIISGKIILSTQLKSFGTILACLASDGTVEHRDRASFEPLQSYMDTDHVYSLSQSGFSYLPGEHNTDIAISCDGSATVVIRPNNKMDALSMFFAYGWQQDQASGDDNSLAEAAIVCLARQYMTMVCANTASDEVLSLLPPSLPEHLQHLFVREAFRLTRHSPDISNLEEKLRQRVVMSESLLPRVYSLQLFLGMNATGRSLTAQYAWAVLNLRHVVISISHVAMMRPSESSNVPHIDMIASQHGLARWGVDLIVYILDALLSVKDIAARDLSKPATGTFENYMQENNNPAFLLVLCSYPRTLLKLLAHVLHRIVYLAEQFKDRARSLQERQHLTQMSMLEKSMPFNFEAFRTCLDHTEVAMHTAPTSAALKPGQPSALPDLALNITGKFSDELEQPLRALLISAIPSLLQDADWSKIHFHDCSWLGLSGMRSMKLAQSYDVLKKTPLPVNAAIRKCRRCGSLTEDINVERPRDVIPWILLGQRNCVCMCVWFVP
ncbi:hypothetical protein AMS68_007582 [Peltaster fructicola]|uniref:Mediator of RNA polymerase II transcription subunit 16 n=1 Tax=Peltaster fructicola TaxID=286661 RepID=A0A6H0Y579_9PEZI|nr:hypothetical protein AMS68_007582 [Peltaster fructicola]